ncbi:MAG: hypothetical protein ICV69_08385 [Thermoleophilaceae bacterium]|nr:hypothetical protein [Thermoleophilaceae bacterium]
MTPLQRNLAEYVTDYYFDRARPGRLTNGRVPADIVFGARKTKPGKSARPAAHLWIRTS